LSGLEDTLALHLRAIGLPAPEREHRFCERRWRFDFAWPAAKVAAEVHGATYTAGRHTRGAGFGLDREKMNAAQLAGWLVLEFTARHVRTGYAVATIEQALEARNGGD
jgi:very-short-patch-repair endonuclease